MDVHGNDNSPEWGWCKAENCKQPAEPLWFSSASPPDDPDVLLCYRHTGEYVGALCETIEHILDVGNWAWSEADNKSLFSIYLTEATHTEFSALLEYCRSGERDGA